MRYTQLDFAPYSPERKSLFQQAQLLLHELVNERIHEYPCNCGVCIYAMYRKIKKSKNRPFSKRTFFVFFLRYDFFLITFVDKRLRRYDPIKKIGSRLWKDAFSKYADFKEFSSKEENYLLKHGSSDIYLDRLMRITRRRTLDMIKKLEREEKKRDVKTFLRGILNKKCFYTYYKRTDDPTLINIIKEIGHNLLVNPALRSPKPLTGLVTSLNGKTLEIKDIPKTI